MCCRMAALQAELELVRGQMVGQQRKMEEVQAEQARVAQRRALLTATIDPLEGELEKVEVLMQGVHEQGRQ